jgi:6-phosphogluconolactonase
MSNQAMNNQQQLFYVGCYTQPEGHVPNGCGEGIYRGILNQQNGEISLTLAYKGLTNPSYLSYNAKDHQIYAVSEVENQHSKAYLLSINNEVCELQSEISTGGEASCHVHSHANKIYVASYMGGSITSFNINNNRLITENHIEYSGTGPNNQRQEAPHAHQCLTSPDGKWLYVCDLGSDKIWIHNLKEPLNETLFSCDTPPGSGPRHLCFHPNLQIAYIICELSGHILICNYDQKSGELAMIQELSSLPTNYEPEPASAAICIHPSGKALYVSNRTHDSCAAFAIDDSGKLSALDWVDCGGKTPRDMNIDPSGNWLLVANQDSNTLCVLKINSETGAIIGNSLKSYACKTPTCISFG